MASNLEKYLDMSLDEYIAKKKGDKSPISAPCTSTPAANKSVSTFKAERRQPRIYDEFDDEDELMAEEPPGEQKHVRFGDKLDKSVGIWRGPSIETSYIDLDYMKDEFDEMFNNPELQSASNKEKEVVKKTHNPQPDLRERLNNNNNNFKATNNNNNFDATSNNNNKNKNNNKNNHNNNNQCSNVKEQQEKTTLQANKQANVNSNEKRWNSNMRSLQQQSISLTSLNTDGGVSFNGGGCNYRRRWNNNRNFRRRYNDGCGNRGNNGFVNNFVQNQNWNSNRNGFANGPNGNNMIPLNNNGRIQRPNQRYNQDVVNKNVKMILDQINGNNTIYANRQAGSVRDLTIELPSGLLLPGRLTANGSLQQSFSSTTQNTPQTPSTQIQTQAQSDLKTMLGVNENNITAGTMAMLAGKLLDLFQSGQQQTVHKPIYDMQIQKEIHELQGKSLLYKCPGGEVVSSDGTGIDNCKITPSSSGVTLNYRFG